MGCGEEKNLKSILTEYQTEINNNFDNWQVPNPLEVSKDASISKRIATLEKFENKLAAIDTLQLEKTELQILNRELELIRTQKSFWQNYYNDPSAFDLTNYYKNIIEQEKDTLKALKILSTELAKAPEHFESAKQLLITPDPEKSALSVQKQLLFLRFLQIELPELIQGSQLSDSEKEQMGKIVKEAKLAAKDYIGYCESLIFEHLDSTIVRPEGD